MRTRIKGVLKKYGEPEGAFRESVAPEKEGVVALQLVEPARAIVIDLVKVDGELKGEMKQGGYRFEITLKPVKQ